MSIDLILPKSTTTRLKKNKKVLEIQIIKSSLTIMSMNSKSIPKNDKNSNNQQYYYQHLVTFFYVLFELPKCARLNNDLE